MRKISVFTAVAFFMLCRASAQEIVGDWVGTLKADAVEAHLILHVTKANDGALAATLDSVDQGIRGIPISSISVQDSTLTFTDAMKVKYEGKIDPGRTEIDGTLIQGGRSFPFHLRREAVPQQPASTSSQVAKHLPGEPVSEEVSWTIGETVVAATITRPDDHAVHPGIVFVAGSGPMDRDWNSPLLPGTNGSARMLANELAKKGFFTIRYDKRTSGPNGGKNLPYLAGKLSFASHQEELAGALNQLLSRAEVNPKQIYAFGNSEGTLHIMKYQLEKTPRFTGLILTGPPGRNIPEILHSQIEAQTASMPNSKEIMKSYDRMMANFCSGNSFAADPSLPQGLNTLVQSFYANLPFTRELMSADSALLIGKITVPTLVLIGKKDIQVDWRADGAVLEKAASDKTNVTFVYPENANHILKNEVRPRAALAAIGTTGYNVPGTLLDSDTVKAIEDWLVQHTR